MLVTLTCTCSFQSLESLLEKAGTSYPDRVGTIVATWTELSQLPSSAMTADSDGTARLIQHLHRSAGCEHTLPGFGRLV